MKQRGDAAKALDWLGAAIATLEAARKMGGREREVRQFLSYACFNRADGLARLRRDAEALADWDSALKVPPPPELHTRAQRQRACTLARMGKSAEAVAVADDLAGSSAKGPKAWYDAACVYAFVAFLERTSPQKAEALRGRAMELLARAEAAGLFRRPARIDEWKKDNELDNLRSREDFQNLQKKIEHKSGTK